MNELQEVWMRRELYNILRDNFISVDVLDFVPDSNKVSCAEHLNEKIKISIGKSVEVVEKLLK